MQPHRSSPDCPTASLCQSQVWGAEAGGCFQTWGSQNLPGQRTLQQKSKVDVLEAPAWREPRTRVLVRRIRLCPGQLRAHSVQHRCSQGLQGLEHLKRSAAASPSGFSWPLTKSHKYKLFPTQAAHAGYRRLPSALPLLPRSALLPQTQFLHSCLC